MALPNAILTFVMSSLLQQPGDNDFTIGGSINVSDETSEASQMVLAAFTSVMIFVLWNRSNVAYNRWWEGGTLLQKTRGEWFNAFSSIMAFTSTKPEHEESVEAYTHLLARLMSLLMCCGLQQVSPNRDRPFEIIDLEGIEPESMDFLNQAPDKVEIILQWIQRSMVLHAQTGVLPVAPPILSRAFQEISRGIVNLQNARKIADFPYPFPLAQVSMILQLLHWATIPIVSSMALPRGWATLFAFFSILVLWCVHFNALDLEFPFGSRANDLPMMEMQQDWNNSVTTLLDKRATRPPVFVYDAEKHSEMAIVMSDASDLYVPAKPAVNKGLARIKIKEINKKKRTNRASVMAKEFREQIECLEEEDLQAMIVAPATEAAEPGGGAASGQQDVTQQGSSDGRNTPGIPRQPHRTDVPSETSSAQAPGSRERAATSSSTCEKEPAVIKSSRDRAPTNSSTNSSVEVMQTHSSHLAETAPGLDGPPQSQTRVTDI